MYAVYQKKGFRPDERGNCLAACIASVLEKEIDSVPQFEELPPGEWKMCLFYWLELMGYSLQQSETARDGKQFCIAVGMSKGGSRHAVVYKEGKTVHDPTPGKKNGDDIKIEYFLYLDKF